ncbi:hypothetical protein AAH154_20110, partial [Phocaeicola vulgatus]
EPYEGKLSRTVLRGEGGSNALDLPDLRYRDVRSIESQDILDSMQYSGIYGLSEKSVLEYVRNCILIVAGNPGVICIQKLYNYDGSIYKYRVKWYGNNWGNWRNVYFV